MYRKRRTRLILICLAVCMVCTFFVSLIFFQQNHASEIHSAILLETESDSVTNGNNTYLSGDGQIVIKRDGIYTKYRTAASVSDLENLPFSVMTGDASGDIFPISDTPLYVQVSEEDEENTEPSAIYCFVKDNTAPTMNITLEKGDQWAFVPNASDSGVGVSAVYYSTALYNTVADIEANATLVDSKVILEESNSPEKLYFYAIDTFKNFVMQEAEELTYVDYTAPVMSHSYLNYVNYVDGAYYFDESAKGLTVYTVRAVDSLVPTTAIQLQTTAPDVFKVEHGLTTSSVASMSSFLADATDGQYSIVSVADDGRDNQGELRTETMVLDSLAPVISQIKVNGNAYQTDSEEDLYNQKIILSFKVTEKNVDTVTVTVGEQVYPATAQNGVYSVTIQDEFQHQALEILVKDKANHQAEFTTDPMLLDCTPPVINSLVCDSVDLMSQADTLHTRDLHITGSVSDSNLDLDSFKLLLEKDGKTATILSGASAIASDGQSFDTTYQVSSDGTYVLRVQVLDDTGNTLDYTSQSIIIDGTKPVLTVSTASGDTFVPQSQQKEKSVVLKMQLDEANPVASDMIQYSCAVTDVLKNQLTEITYKLDGITYTSHMDTLLAHIKNIDVWNHENGIYTLDIEFLTEGNYKFSTFKSSDKMGGVATASGVSFVIDGTAPVAQSITFSEEQNNYEDYQYISQNNIAVMVQATDMMSQIRSVTIQYQIDNKVVSLDTKKESANTYSYVFGNQYGIKGIIKSITLTDAKGNVSVQSLGSGVIVDKESQDVELLSVSIKDDTAQTGKTVFNQDISLSLSASDTFSGLQAVRGDVNGVPFAYDYTKSNKLVYQYQDQKVLSANRSNEGNDIRVNLTAVDNAGNTYSVYKSYAIDITKPTIEITYNHNTPINGLYYNQSRQAKVVIKDKNLDLSKTKLFVTKDGEQKIVDVSFNTNDNQTYVATYNLAEDGEYLLSVITEDLAGNKAIYKETESFIIDTTNPVITLQFDNNNAIGNMYYASARTATITITEKNFDESKVNISTTASLNGSSGTMPSVSAFSSNGDVHTATVQFAADGDYTISVTAMDLAGNQGNSVSEQNFTIDKTQPTITITQVQNNVSYNSTITPVITIEDINYASEQVSISLVGSKNGSNKNLNYTKSETASSGVFTYQDFLYDPSVDDVYSLHVEVSDRAGNHTSSNVSFKVNRFGSAYILDEYTKDAIDVYYTNAENDFIITEINVDEIAEQEIYYSKDGDITYLKENDGYTVSQSVNEYQWNEYLYKIHTDEIKDDGIYTYTLYSKDTVGNEMSTKTQNIDFTVCIDKTSPTVVITGVEDGHVYEESSREVQIEVLDNIALDFVDVYLNGEKTSYKAEEISDNKITLSVPESAKEQSLMVYATDMAGNVYDGSEKAISFTLSSNTLVTTAAQKHSLVWVIGVVAVLVLLGIIIIIIAIRKKNKKSN